jgi:hypothetical protein
MRTFLGGVLFIIVAGVLSGCDSGGGTKSGASEGMQADVAAGAKSCVMQAGGVNVLKLTGPANMRCLNADGSLQLHGPEYNVEFWLMRGAKTVDEGVGRVSSQIVDEFKDFKADRTTDLTVAGSPAKRLVGHGREADDGDPGEADVIVFKVGEHIFVGCNHGEGLVPAGQQGLLMVVQSAQRP